MFWSSFLSAAGVTCGIFAGVGLVALALGCTLFPLAVWWERVLRGLGWLGPQDAPEVHVLSKESLQGASIPVGVFRSLARATAMAAIGEDLFGTWSFHVDTVPLASDGRTG